MRNRNRGLLFRALTCPPPSKKAKVNGTLLSTTAASDLLTPVLLSLCAKIPHDSRKQQALLLPSINLGTPNPAELKRLRSRNITQTSASPAHHYHETRFFASKSRVAVIRRPHSFLLIRCISSLFRPHFASSARIATQWVFRKFFPPFYARAYPHGQWHQSLCDPVATRIHPFPSDRDFGSIAATLDYVLSRVYSTALHCTVLTRHSPAPGCTEHQSSPTSKASPRRRAPLPAPGPPFAAIAALASMRRLPSHRAPLVDDFWALTLNPNGHPGIR